MAKVGRFITDPKAGAYCQITLDSGEKIIVNHDKGGFKGGNLTIETTKWWGGGQRVFACNLDSPEGKAYRLNGQKIWISLADLADLVWLCDVKGGQREHERQAEREGQGPDPPGVDHRGTSLRAF